VTPRGGGDSHIEGALGAGAGVFWGGGSLTRLQIDYFDGYRIHCTQ
jgi:hypothetical protein